MIAALGAWVGLLVGPNVMVSSTNSNFMTPLAEAFGVSRTAISTVLALSVWSVALCVPLAGRAMDKYGVRRVLIPGVILFGLTFLLMSQARDIWQYAALQLLLSIAVAMHASVGYAKVVALWFDRNRGVVLGVCIALGAGVGQTTMPKLSQAMIETWGWRGGYIGIGLIVLCVGFPLIFLLVRTPAKQDLADDPATLIETPDVPGLTRAEALRRPTFYILFFAIMFGSMSLIGTLQHAVPMLRERGFSANIATTMLSFSFAGVILGEFSSGLLVDRINTPRIILPYFVCAFIGLLIVHSAHDTPLLLAGALMMGMGLGGEVGQNAYLVSRYFGLKAFGGIYGLTFAASNLGIGVGLIVMGLVHDLTGGYDAARYVFGATMAVSVLCIALLGPFTFHVARPRR